MMGSSFFFGVMKNVLELESGDGCTTPNILKTTKLCTLKKANFMVCKLHLNKIYWKKGMKKTEHNLV